MFIKSTKEGSGKRYSLIEMKLAVRPKMQMKNWIRLILRKYNVWKESEMLLYDTYDID